MRDYFRFAKVALTVFVVAMSLIVEAHSGWREDTKTFKIGLVGNDKKTATLRLVEPFRLALQNQIGMPVKVIVTDGYSSLINAQMKNRVHYAVHSASSFATLWARCKCAEPLVAAKLPGGDVEYFSVLIVKKNRIASINDLKGKRIAVSHKNSLSGYIIPKHELHNKELNFVDSPAKVDDTVVVVAGTAAQSTRLFEADLVDGLLGWSTMSGLVNSGYSAGTLHDMISKNEQLSNELQVIWKSRPILTGPHTISTKVPEDIKSGIRKFLLGLYEKDPRAYDSIESYEGGGFKQVELENYKPLISFVDANEDVVTSNENN